jgi:hypothetical protein
MDLIERARGEWLMFCHRMPEETAALQLQTEAEELPVSCAREYLRGRYETKKSDLASTVQYWVTIELRKDSPIFCFKIKQDDWTWQSGSFRSSSTMLLRHAVVIKIMLLAGTKVQAHDFLKCDFFKAVLPFAMEHC